MILFYSVYQYTFILNFRFYIEHFGAMFDYCMINFTGPWQSYSRNFPGQAASFFFRWEKVVFSACERWEARSCRINSMLFPWHGGTGP